ncbi:MAG: hypothetical protein ACRDD1_14220, partial [Planctomycetia bacterium]
WTLAYQGRIDDQLGVGFTRKEPTKRELNDAVAAILAGKTPTVAAMEASGCVIGRARTPKENASVTFHGDVAAIFNKRCVACHRPGEAAPFALQDYGEAAGWAEMIREVTQDRRMPPWNADPTVGTFANDCRLPESELATINAWVAAGAPEGDPKLAPPAPVFETGWAIGKPDVVFTMPKPYKVPARGTVAYQFFTVETGFTEDKWIKKAEARPGAREVVHHIIIALDTGDGGARRNAAGAGSDWLTATAPGALPMILEDGQAKRLPAGARLVFQMHYTPNGKAQEDLSSVGLVFADPAEVKHEVATTRAANRKFVIPAGAHQHKVEADFTCQHDLLLLSFFPHMHVRGSSFRYDAVYADGRTEPLLVVPKYDFAWQSGYLLAEPKRLPKGTRVHCVATYDNSAENPNNPDHAAEVRWGDQTWEEMMIGYFNATRADRELTDADKISRMQLYKRAPAPTPERIAELSTEAKAVGASEEAFQKLIDDLGKTFPQLDRVCVTSNENGMTT